MNMSNLLSMCNKLSMGVSFAYDDYSFLLFPPSPFFSLFFLSVSYNLMIMLINLYW